MVRSLGWTVLAVDFEPRRRVSQKPSLGHDVCNGKEDGCDKTENSFEERERISQGDQTLAIQASNRAAVSSQLSASQQLKMLRTESNERTERVKGGAIAGF